VDLSEGTFAKLVDELEDLDGQRTAGGGYAPEVAAQRMRVERELMKAMTARVGDDERRKFMRVPCQVDVRLRHGTSAVSGVVQDLGVGGVFVHTPLGLGVGESVDVEIARRPGQLDHGLKVHGTVAWNVDASPGRRGLGIAFTIGDEGHERRLRRFTLELLRCKAEGSTG
jgi:hypothetical protein